MSLQKKMNQETYDAISQIGNPSLIAEKLKEYDAEFREAYRKFGNALRNKAYRNKNKDQINQARNIKRNELKPIINNKDEITTEFINDIDTNVKPDYKNNLPIKQLNPSTIITYKNTIKNIYKLYKNKDLPDDNDILKFLDGKNKRQYSIMRIKKDFNFIIENSKDIAEKHFSSINILYSVFSRLDYGMKDIKNALYPYVMAKNKYYQDNRHKIICNQDAIDNISFETDDVLKNIDKIHYPYDKLLFALLFLMPTRRIHDYRYTKIAYKNGNVCHFREGELTKFAVSPIGVIDKNWFLRDMLIVDDLIFIAVGNYELQVYQLNETAKQKPHLLKVFNFDQIKGLNKGLDGEIFINDYSGVYSLELAKGVIGNLNFLFRVNS